MKDDYSTKLLNMQEILEKNIAEAEKKYPIVERFRTISALNLVMGTFLALCKNKNATMDDILYEFKAMDINITRQGILKRYNQKCSEFFREIGELFLKETLYNANRNEFQIFKNFSSVQVGDCTLVRMSESLKDKFPGCGYDASPASLKIMCKIDLLFGNILDIKFREGKASDYKMYEEMAAPSKGTLELYDRGFYSIKRFKSLNDKGCFFVSRLPAGTKVFYEDHQYKLGELLSKFKQDKFEIDVCVGKEKLNFRLVAFRVSEEVQKERLAKLKKKKQRADKKKKSKEISQEQKLANQWSVYITNLPSEEYSADHIYTLYRARWQIELLFKLWKSEFALDSKPGRGKSGYKDLCMFYARLIVIYAFYNIMLSEGVFLCEKSPKKMVKVIQRNIWKIAESIYCKNRAMFREAIKETLEMLEQMQPRQIRKKHPSTRQLLEQAVNSTS